MNKHKVQVEPEAVRIALTSELPRWSGASVCWLGMETD